MLVEVGVLGGFTVAVNGTRTRDRAIAELRALSDSPGDAGVMAPLALSILARLLARRGDNEADDVLTGHSPTVPWWTTASL